MNQTSSLRRFAADTRGSVALMFGLAVLSMLVAVGFAIDYARSVSYQQRVQAALDNAVLAATKVMVQDKATDTQVREVAESYYQSAIQSLKGMRVKNTKPVVTIDRDHGTVQLRTDAAVDTVIAKVAGINEIKVDATSGAALSVKNIELGIMLDVSGSMRGDKLAALKAAGNELFDTLLDGTATKRTVRIGLAPYSTSVNAGTYADEAKGRANPHKCVSERAGRDAFTDASPKPGKHMGGKPSWCPDNTVLALTSDKATLVNSLAAYQADGNTAGHLGIAWAWYLVSSNWQDFWPAESKPDDKDPGKVVKGVIIMTDGEFNKEYEEDDGKSAEQARKLCRNMKQDGIVIFTVGFQAPEEAKELLAECASSAEYTFDAANGAQLKNAFVKIGDTLNDLRITN